MDHLSHIDRQLQKDVEIGEDIEIVNTEAGRIKMKLKAKEMQRHLSRSNPYTKFEGLDIYIYDQTGAIESTLQADSARIDNKTDLLEAKGNVRVRGANGEMLKTETLTWDKVNKQIKTDKKIAIETENERIYGVGLSSNQQFTNYTIHKITGTIKVKSDEFN